MSKVNLLTQILAIAGSVLTWIPILAPILICAVTLFQRQGFRFDYLMPAELFPVVLVGGLLLLWAAARARMHLRLIGISFIMAIVLLMGGQALAVGTGLTTGATTPGGWQWALVLGAIILYDLAVIAVGVGGISLVRDLFRKHPSDE